MSDVHFGRYFSGKYPTNDDSETAFDTALDTFDKLDVFELTAISGDITVDGEESSLKKYYDITSSRMYPVFSCAGNHDYKALKNDKWKEYVNKEVYAKENSVKGIVDVSDNDFVFVPPSGENEDVFVFLSQGNGVLISDNQFEWLNKQLETYKNKNVYLFFHTFLTGVNGSDTGCGNVVSHAGVKYNYPFKYNSGDELVFRSILMKYKNVTFFSGHSHFLYSLQELNNNLNIYDYEGKTGLQLHLSSVSSPRSFNSEGKMMDLNGTASEGAIVSVYDDSVIFYGTDFYNGEILSYATFLIPKVVPTVENVVNDTLKNKDNVSNSENANKSKNNDKGINVTLIVICSAVLLIGVGATVIVIKKKKSKNS